MSFASAQARDYQYNACDAESSQHSVILALTIDFPIFALRRFYIYLHIFIFWKIWILRKMYEIL